MVSYAEPQIDRNMHCIKREGKGCKARALRVQERKDGGRWGARERQSENTETYDKCQYHPSVRTASLFVYTGVFVC